ncbi:MAG TPA: hypothetical protein VMU87_20825 [Stellaceae bacterium]|nr:hypothetical protein [Stellaceae bacterium]
MMADRSRRAQQRWRGAAVAALMLGAFSIASCTPPVSTGAFRSTGQIETKLKRGVSTKTDVLSLLGVPNGPGSWLLPALDPSPREIWYYEDMAMSGSTLRMQMIFVFFKGNLYDGYLWTSGAGALETKF